MKKASWIWSTKDALGHTTDACFLRKRFTLPVRPTAATIVVTADNGFDLYVNGHYVAGEGGLEGAIWETPERFRIEGHLLEGANVIALRGENLGGPGGLVAAVRIQLPNDKELTFATDASWLANVAPRSGWTEADHNDSLWKPAVVLGPLGMKPWGVLSVPSQLSALKQRTGRLGKFHEPAADERWPAGIVFLGGRAPLSSDPALPQAIWPIQGSRAYFEYDVPAPSALGHRLYAMVPAKPGVEPKLLLDAGKGIIGPATVSFDGREILFSMAPAGEKFIHLYRIAADGTGLEQLTHGPWHDYDPAMLPDGRIAFASTRIGSRDEYHGNTARSLFVLSADRKSIKPLTYHIVADGEPRVMADGRIAFIRSDNFFERAKVETHIHVVRPDGSAGEVLIGPNRSRIPLDWPLAAEDDALWLRSFGFGSPAPLPDGRVACLSYVGPIITPLVTPNARPNAAQWDKIPLAAELPLHDIAPLPDGRLLCSTIGGQLGMVNPDTGRGVLIHQSDTYDLHAAAYLGPRPKPPVIGSGIKPADEERADKTGFLLCQNIFHTKQTGGAWRRVRAVRVMMGAAMTTRSARHPYDHIGVEGVELGTVPIASDGSFYVRVPADRALALQAIDAEGRPVVNELSWIYVRPNERRSCVGCHQQRQAAPEPAGALAASLPPVDLVPHDLSHRFRANNAANGGVLNLQVDRFREAASIDLYRPQLLGPDGTVPPGRPTEVADLCRILRAGGDAEKVSAAQRLALFRDRKATAALAEALVDRAPAVRLAAAQALSACGNRTAVEPLLGALADRDAHVAQAARIALEHLTGHEEELDVYNGRQTRLAARQRWQAWLAENDWNKIERDLSARLGESDPVEVQDAIEALGHVGGTAAAEALRKFVASSRHDSLRAQMAAIRALGHLQDGAAVPLLAQLLESSIAERPFQPAKSHEFGWAQEPIQLAGAAAEALGWIGTAEAEQALLSAFGKLAPFWYYTYRNGDHEWLMGCHSSVPHYRILEALDAIGSSRIGPLAGTILKAVPMDPDRGLVYENDACETVTARVLYRGGAAAGAIEACLAILGDPSAKGTPELLEAVSASPPAVSVGVLAKESRAAQLLSVVCLEPKYAPQVRAAFERFRKLPPDRNRSWTLFFLARTLGKLQDKDAVEVLEAALNTDRTEASFGIPDPPNVFLHEAMTPAYRAAAADALGRIKATSAGPSLLRALGNYENAMEVREAAARALRTLSDPATLAELERIAADYPEVTTRNVLLETCSRIRSR